MYIFYKVLNKEKEVFPKKKQLFYRYKGFTDVFFFNFKSYFRKRGVFARNLGILCLKCNKRSFFRLKRKHIVKGTNFFLEGGVCGSLRVIWREIRIKVVNLKRNLPPSSKSWRGWAGGEERRSRVITPSRERVCVCVSYIY
jgi:hypothetical protein